ncbi:MAG TPA: NAD(P)/FAD-dependent oxidoreductase [Thermodesulfobacteriota bacterium]|nr:NAD(P)/FAD-dependent oxidoreductase [Thermodesulfobacteriota bacterium]
MMFEKHYDIVIIGAGPAGLVAGIESYTPSRKILILEKMPRPALKLRISGKGRCNITNDASLEEFLSHFGKNGRFLKFAFAEFFNTDLLRYFEKLGVTFKLEQGGRYFPQKDNALEIVEALLNKVKTLKIPLAVNSEVTGISKLPDGKFSLAINKKNPVEGNVSQSISIHADNVLLATGGKSYPRTGSTGTGYKLASQLGHTVTPVLPALVPIETKGDTAKKLQGLSLRNVKAKIVVKNKKVDERFGEMVFTDFGVSGPIILSLSGTVVKLLQEKQKVVLSIDLKPALDHETLDKRLLREINENSRQSFKSLLKKLLPRKLMPVFIERLKISEKKELNQITIEERKRLRMLLKEFLFDITGYRSFDEAIVTSGGVSIQEINPQTMESKLVKGLYFAGELIDIDADTGGFNLQAAFSTGWVAGRALCRTAVS